MGIGPRFADSKTHALVFESHCPSWYHSITPTPITRHIFLKENLKLLFSLSKFFREIGDPRMKTLPVDYLKLLVFPWRMPGTADNSGLVSSNGQGLVWPGGSENRLAVVLLTADTNRCCESEVAICPWRSALQGPLELPSLQKQAQPH